NYCIMAAVYSDKFNLKQEKALKDRLLADGFSLSPINYAFWQAKKNGINAVLYKSGKIVVQGKEVDAFTSKYLGITKQTSLKMESSHSQLITRIGTDESGKGDYFGPLVVAGVLADKENIDKLLEIGVKDSKKLNDVQIAKMAVAIKNNFIHSIVKINPAKYNQLYDSFKNLNKLLAWGHARVIENILEKKDCDNVLSDKFGDESLIKNALMKKGKQINLEQRVRAEEDLAVAAASIIARDEYVKSMAKLSNQYDIILPKGASEKVKEQAKLFIQKHSKENLGNIAKLHFKTTLEI
ncbi:MAG: ribonuclease HIII, partial [Candidatus Gastranaerophilales bacterium]|nr:ribonuclease HIII [Candidatus Gastranaerophilales bacterium]